MKPEIMARARNDEARASVVKNVKHGNSADPVSRDASECDRRKMAGTKTLNLALQGGGAHGAFTWGVIDRLLEEKRVVIDGISATSAGAMNATVCAYGMAAGGRQGARKALENFWRRISHAGDFTLLRPTLFDKMTGNHSLEWSPFFVGFEMMTRLLSPYQFNPMNYNPLREVLTQSVDFDLLRRAKCPIRLYLSATNVRTGKVKVFNNDEIGPDAVLASGCLPFLFQAVEIDGEAYWDGGYMGNPVIFPLIYNCDTRDVLIVHVNPIQRDEVPQTATRIMNRINEISFNSSLMREMRAISFVTRLIDEKEIDGNKYRRMRIHSICADDVMNDLSVASKLNSDWDFLTGLRDAGRERAACWLDEHFGHIGEKTTVDLVATYL
jgi:NTE family protein